MNIEKASLINHINSNENNVPSYQREEEEVPIMQICTHLLRTGFQESSSSR